MLMSSAIYALLLKTIYYNVTTTVELIDVFFFPSMYGSWSALAHAVVASQGMYIYVQDIVALSVDTNHFTWLAFYSPCCFPNLQFQSTVDEWRFASRRKYLTSNGIALGPSSTDMHCSAQRADEVSRGNGWSQHDIITSIILTYSSYRHYASSLQCILHSTCRCEISLYLRWKHQWCHSRHKTVHPSLACRLSPQCTHRPSSLCQGQH